MYVPCSMRIRRHVVFEGVPTCLDVSMASFIIIALRGCVLVVRERRERIREMQRDTRVCSMVDGRRNMMLHISLSWRYIKAGDRCVCLDYYHHGLYGRVVLNLEMWGCWETNTIKTCQNKKAFGGLL